jgi:hypothetical protein
VDQLLCSLLLFSPKILLRIAASLTPPCAILFRTTGSAEKKYSSAFAVISTGSGMASHHVYKTI